MVPEEAARVREILEQHLAAGTPWVRLLIRCRHQGGHDVMLESSGRPYHDGERVLRGFRGVHRPTVGTTQAAEALRASEERLRAVVESTPLGMHFYELQPDGRLFFVGANAAAERVMGIPFEPLLGLPFEQAFPAVADTDIPAIYRRVVERGEPDSFEHEHEAPDGTRVAFEVHVFRYTPRGVAAIFADITHRKHAEQHRQRLEAQLQQSQKMEALGRLAGGVAHDFNNLLTGISGNLELMAMDLATRDPLRELVREMREASERASDLTRQLLAFSRHQVVAPRPLNLNDAIDGSIFMVERLLGEAVKLDLICADDLGAVELDPGQFEQVLMNLVMNARDAMPDGGMLTLVTENAELDEAFCRHRSGLHPGPHIHLRVKDSGVGMVADVLARAFEPFFSTKPHDQASGLGLSTVYGIVRQHEGYIEASSEPGWGTTMDLYFPRVAGPPEVLSTPVPPELCGRGETVLVVEDEGVVRQVTRRALERLGYRVLSASHGAEALRVAKEHEGALDLLLTDVVLPFMKGPEVAERLSLHQPQLRVLFMSGYTGDVLADQGVPKERHEVLSKPFSPKTLAKHLRQILDG
jgi:PAS domain S-box-containing protein